MGEDHHPPTSAVLLLFSVLLITGEVHLPPISSVLLLFS
jgi:hypothetical protein